jgi:hypothetical protein
MRGSIVWGLESIMFSHGRKKTTHGSYDIHKEVSPTVGLNSHCPNLCHHNRSKTRIPQLSM